jgi:hypothetical protein
MRTLIDENRTRLVFRAIFFLSQPTRPLNPREDGENYSENADGGTAEDHN